MCLSERKIVQPEYHVSAQRLIFIAHEGNNICLYRFSFIYVTNALREDAYICPIYAMNRTTESANLRYGTHGYGMSAYKEGWRQNTVIFNVL